MNKTRRGATDAGIMGTVAIGFALAIAFLCGLGTGRESVKKEAVAAGAGEWYLDQDANKQFRFLPHAEH